MSVVGTLNHDGNRGQLPDDASSSRWGWPALAAAAVGTGAVLWRVNNRNAAAGADSGADGSQAAAPNWKRDLAANAAYQAALYRAAHDPAVRDAVARAPAPAVVGYPAVDRALATFGRVTGLAPALPAASEAVVALTEFVVLPDETTAGVMELGLSVRGEVRLHTYTPETLRATIKLSTPAAPGSATASVSQQSWVNSAAMGGADAVQGEAARVAGPTVLTDIALHDTVDERLFARTQTQLRCVPGRTASSLLMTYASTTADEVVPAVVARECTVQPSTTPGAYVLTVALEVTSSAQDICVQVVLPKRAELRAAPAIDCGTWGRPQGGAPTEFQWHAGDVAGRGRGASVASGAGGAADGDDDGEEPVGYRAASPARPADLQCIWEYVVPPETLAYASRPNTPHPGAAGGGGGGSSNEQSLHQHSAPWQALLPGVTLSYMAPTLASGLRVRKVSFEAPAEPDGSPAPEHVRQMAGITGGWVPAHSAAHTTASYRTMYSQALKVRPEL